MACLASYFPELNPAKKYGQNTKYHSQIDFKNPCNGIIGGLPGFLRPTDRVRQLEMIKNSMIINDNAKSYYLKSNLNNKRHSMYCVTQKKEEDSEIPIYKESSFKNDYDFMKNKFQKRPFNIITNTLKRV